MVGVGLLFARTVAADDWQDVSCRHRYYTGMKAGLEMHGDQECQGLGPDERLVLGQLFRETGKEERGEPKIEAHDRDGQVSMKPTDSQGMKAIFPTRQSVR